MSSCQNEKTKMKMKMSKKGKMKSNEKNNEVWMTTMKLTTWKETNKMWKDIKDKTIRKWIQFSKYKKEIMMMKGVNLNNTKFIFSYFDILMHECVLCDIQKRH